MSCIVPVKSLGTTGTRYDKLAPSIGIIPSSAGVRYNAGDVGWNIPELQETTTAPLRAKNKGSCGHFLATDPVVLTYPPSVIYKTQRDSSPLQRPSHFRP